LLRNSSGNPEVTIANYPVDKEVLRKVAETTAAKFFEAGDEARLREIYDEITSLEAGSINCLLGPDAATANRDNFIYVRLLQEAKTEDTTAGAGLLVADEALEATLVKALKKTKGSITASDLATLESLDASNAEIRSLSGLEHATKLTKLQLGGNQITNLTPLAKLTNLTELAISHNPVSEEQIAMLQKALPDCDIKF
jgi:hypothetical protein